MTKFKSKKMNKFRKALGIILISLVFLTIIIHDAIVGGVISTLISVGIAIVIVLIIFTGVALIVDDKD